MEVLPKMFRPGLNIELSENEARTLLVALDVVTTNTYEKRAAHQLAKRLAKETKEALNYAPLSSSSE